MSRRHAPTTFPSLTRLFGLGLAMVLALAALVPVAAVAQDAQITPSKLQHEWQLLRQLDRDGELIQVPAGVGATMLMRSGFASGRAACSTYDSTYAGDANFLTVVVDPEQVQWRECDPVSRAFDELFYENLGGIASVSRADSVLVVDNALGEELMRFTRAKIDNDPTTTRWSLARIGQADGSVEPVIDGLEPWVEFLRGGSVVGNTGCGSFLGKYATNEGRIDITDVDHRLIGCFDSARTQAERILATLDEITDFQVGPAGLALRDELGNTRLALTPDLDLQGRIWTPTEIRDASGELVFGPGVGRGNELTTSAVKFISGKLEGRSICRPFTGNALRSGLAVSIGGITFIPADSTCKGRTGNVQKDQVEEAFVVALEDTSSYALRGDELALNDVDGITRAILEPQAPLAGTTWQLFNLRQGKKLRQPNSDVPITAVFEEDTGIARVGLLQGQTGVSNARGENEYFGNFDSKAATVIDILELQTDGNGCRGNQAKRAPCKTQDLFLRLLESADSYVVRGEDLKFYRGSNNILNFRPQLFAAAEE